MNLHLDSTRHSVRRVMVAGGLGLAALVGLQVPADVGANDVSHSGAGGAGAFIPMALPSAPSYSAVGGAGAFIPVARPVVQQSSAAGGAGALVPMAPPSAPSHPAAGGAGAFIPMGP